VGIVNALFFVLFLLCKTVNFVREFSNFSTDRLSRTWLLQPSESWVALVTSVKSETTPARTPLDASDEVYLSPAQITKRWPFHIESIRRKIRRGEIASVVIGRRRLVALSELKRIEAEGWVPARSLWKK
jgi:hypothetical protein